MAYRTLLVPLFDEDSLDGIVDVALALAGIADAHVVGLNVIPSPSIYGYYAIGMAATYGDQWVRHRMQLADRLGERFVGRVDAQGGVPEWRVLRNAVDTTDRCIAEMANTVDLVIMGSGVAAGRGTSRATLTSGVLQASGRPVVVVPHERADGPAGRRVFVAWDGGGPATRALWNALPLLATADAVRVQRVVPPGGLDAERTPWDAVELAASLARHGVQVEVAASRAGTSEVGAELLGTARDWNADTLVCGAWGHGRVRGLILGDTTRHLIENARVPLFMAH